MMFLRSKIHNLAFIFLLFFISCKHSYQQKIIVEKDDEVENFFIHANKKIIQNEELKIDSLIAETGVPFFRDSTGIRFFIDSYNRSIDSLMFAIDGDVVSIAYNCFVFDDIANIYDSHLTDTISFKIGYSKQMRGLNYGIKLLQIGDKSKIIIPSYLGFGMSGYGKSVPPYSTLLLNIKLLNIEK
jgi:peptidyl-prolyl cis-trans isomerase A (cyclophilin A)